MPYRYGGEFVKLLQVMHQHFLPELSRSKEAEVQAVRTMLDHYVTSGVYMVEPEGRDMPRIDMSSVNRA